MINLPYSLVIEATDDPNFFGFYSPELPGFTGVGNSIEDCIYKARHGMKEHLGLLAERGLPLPPENEAPEIRIHNSLRAAG
jgi:predicted RNase H-like HicB family nuclease